MKFIYVEKAEKAPTFGDVQTDQFFVDRDGYLCQKSGAQSLTVVAKPDGTPYSTWLEKISPTREIKRIIPLVEKIEF